MKIGSKDIDWLNQNYPSLAVDSYDEKSVNIKGFLEFSAAYDQKRNLYTIKPTLTHCRYPIINDTYQIEIVIYADQNRTPLVKEAGRRILDKAREFKVDISNFHIYSDMFGKEAGSLCMMGPLDQEIIKGNISLADLIERILIPFFYDNSYYENNGTRLRPDYSHGIWGALENYYDLSCKGIDGLEERCLGMINDTKELKAREVIKRYIYSKSKLKGHNFCPYCSKRKVRNCHNKIFRAIFLLREKVRSRKY